MLRHLIDQGSSRARILCTLPATKTLDGRLLRYTLITSEEFKMSGKWTENIFQPDRLTRDEKLALERRQREEAKVRAKKEPESANQEAKDGRRPHRQ
jgi:hypothetical protein